MLTKLRTKIRRLRKFYLSDKHYAEYNFWRKEVVKRELWYKGEIRNLWGICCPVEEDKVSGFSLRENAIRTFITANSSKYLVKLNLPKDYFTGKKILDVGCGPNPWIATFVDCEIYGIDPLINEYRSLGFPMEKYDKRLNYIAGNIEKIPIPDDYFDAIVAVNSIDHVDSFEKAASEIKRVLKPAGEIRIEAHYHKSTICEPWELNDKMILKHFESIGIKKIKEQYIMGKKGKEVLATWGNK